MPDYLYTLTVPANTAKDDAIEQECNLSKGVLVGGEIFFPPGCSGLCHVIIADEHGQLYPANKDDTFHGDSAPIRLVGRHALDVPPFRLKIHAWNEDVTYQHVPQVHLEVLPEDEASPFRILQEFIDILKRLLGMK